MPGSQGGLRAQVGTLTNFHFGSVGRCYLLENSVLQLHVPRN